MSDQQSGTRTSVHRVMVKPGARLALAVIVAYLYGWAAGRTHAPSDPSAFWIGNLAAPYLVIGFLAGTWVFQPAARAAAAGAASAMAAVAGFYNFFMIGNVTNSQMDLPVTVTARSVVLQSYGRWFANMLWGDPGGTPWLAIALACGLVSGVAGYLWRAKNARLGVLVIAAALIAEPLVYLGKLNALVIGSAYGMSRGNLVIWGCEFLLGVAIFTFAVQTHAGRASMPVPQQGDAT